MSSAPGLPPSKRYIATHNTDGKSVYTTSPDQVFTSGGNNIFKAKSYAVANVPANLEGDADIKAYTSGPESVTSFQRGEIVMPTENGKYNGANLLVVDLGPGAYSVMHRTVSVDYSICVLGRIIHELDSGERVTLSPGDHIVQRGTNHRWINASQTESARFVAVTLPCEPFEVAGQTIEEKFPQDDPGFKPTY